MTKQKFINQRKINNDRRRKLLLGCGRVRDRGGDWTTEGRHREWEINIAINNLGGSHLSSWKRQLIRKMNGLSPLPCANGWGHWSWHTDRKKDCLSVLLSLVHKQLFESMHPLKQKWQKWSEGGECTSSQLHTLSNLLIYSWNASHSLHLPFHPHFHWTPDLADVSQKDNPKHVLN